VTARMLSAGKEGPTWRRFGQCFTALAIGACVSAPGAQVARNVSAAGDDVETTVFLVGDTGEPSRAAASVIAALGETARQARGERVIVFLGDNVYPDGIPDSSAPSHALAEAKLRVAVDMILATGARGLFVPGNHDWGPSMEVGVLGREEQLVRYASAGAANLLPADGCPGPAIVDIGRRLRLIALDTEWWLRDARERSGTACATTRERDVGDSLRAVLGSAGERQVVVVAHHPLVSGGPHGGHFGWREHVFPFRDISGWMWIPLPLVGSAYPFTRSRVGREEDVFGVANTRMRATLESAFVSRPPLVYAAAHDHGLQVLNGESARFLVVSGGGSDGDLNPVHALPSTRFARSANGFMRLEMQRDGRVRLSVISVDASGRALEEFAMWLT